VSDELPEGWADATLGSCIDVLDSRRVPVNSEERAKRIGAVPYYGATGQVGWIDDHLFDEELLLLGEDGAPFLDKSKPIAYLIRGKSWVNNHAHVLRARSGVTSNEFLNHALNAAAFDDYVNGTTRLKLTQAAMMRIPIRLPPLVEQRRIVAKIDALMERVTSARERLETVPVLLRRVRRAVLAIVSGDSRDDDDQWEQVCFGDLLVGDGPQNGLYKPQSAYGDGVSIVRIDDFHDGKLKPVSSLRRLRLEPAEVEKYGLREGEILINRVNSLKFLGKAVMVPPLDQPLVFESNMMRCRVDERRLVPAFALLYLLSPRGSEALRVNAKHAVNQASINQQDVTGLVIPLPPVDVQTAIVAQVRRLLAAVERIEHVVAAASARAGKVSQAVLQRAFSGELVPTEAALALAEGRSFETAEQMLLRLSPHAASSSPDLPTGKGPRGRKSESARAAPRSA
jgi:type I restriction enzyme S subunit